ncbi:MAG: PQQ-binding-like beta-propeller repeat protein [Planctomycetaceae bacterium]
MKTPISRRRSLSLLAASAAVVVPSRWSSGFDESPSSAPVGGPTATSWAAFRYGPEQRGIAGSELSAKPEVTWEASSKDGWVATCAIVGNHVYAPALEGYLYCFDRLSGKELWKYRSIEDPDPKKFAAGFKAAPLVTADAVYVGDEDGILHAVNRRSGELLWKYTTDAEIAGGVAVYNDQLLLASHDAFLYCLSKDGTEQWKFQTQDRINCSPGIADSFTFVSGCDEHLRVIDLKNGKEVRDVEMNSFLIASPAIVGDMLYVGSHGGDVAAVNWKTGEVTWLYRGDRDMPFHASAAVTDEVVLVGSHDKHMHGIDRASGKARWKFPTKARIECSAAVVDQRVFFGSGDGNIYGLAIEDGSEVWKFNAGKPINAGIAIGEGCMVVGEDAANGKLRCFA